MGNIRLLSREKRKEVAVGSPTYYFYFVFNHLAGVNPPNILPFYDFAIIKVGALPEQVYLKSAL
jgi:hypothetical protein